MDAEECGTELTAVLAEPDTVLGTGLGMVVITLGYVRGIGVIVKI